MRMLVEGRCEGRYEARYEARCEARQVHKRCSDKVVFGMSCDGPLRCRLRVLGLWVLGKLGCRGERGMQCRGMGRPTATREELGRQGDGWEDRRKHGKIWKDGWRYEKTGGEMWGAFEVMRKNFGGSEGNCVWRDVEGGTRSAML